jgi:hypothetical protein
MLRSNKSVCQRNNSFSCRPVILCFLFPFEHDDGGFKVSETDVDFCRIVRRYK